MSESEPEGDTAAGSEGRAALFQRDASVEVTSKEPGFTGAWFEGWVVRVGKQNKERLTVEYDHLLDDADSSRHLREVVDASFVRPRRLPPAAPEEFSSGDAVEAFINDGWWVGDVVETISESLFVVMFTDGDVLRISRANLRKRLEWVRGKWVYPVKQMHVVREITPNRKHRDVGGENTLRRKRGDVVREITPKRKRGDVVREITPKRKRGRPPGSSSKMRDKSSPVKGRKKMEVNLSVEHILQRFEEREANYSDSECKVIDAPRLDDEANTETVCSQVSVNRVTKVAGDHIVSSGNRSPQIAVMEDVEVEGKNPNLTPLHGGSGEALDEDRANTFSESCGVVAESAALDSNGTGKLNDLPHEHSPKLDLELAITEASPQPLTFCSFAKMAPIWEVVLSMDIFRTMPQHPHFHPLEQFIEESREGMALGHMINFASLANSIRTTKHDTPICVLEKRLEVLGDFEPHGFDVQEIKLRLQDLIQAKRNYDKFEQDLAEQEMKITENEKESSMIDTKIDDIDKKVSDLEHSIALLRAKRATFKTTKEMCQFELSQLQNNIQVLQEGYADARKSFYSTVARGAF